MQKTLTLMNKNHPVIRILYDDEIHATLKIKDIIDLDYAPPGILNAKGIPDRRTVNEWQRGRLIPASRQHLSKTMPYLDDTASLAERSMWLSLSDRYWITEDPNDNDWHDINFFDNPFSEDLGYVTIGETPYDENKDLFSPNSTLGGNLQKKWTIQNGQRILLKSGSKAFNQEPWNEAVATALHKRILNTEDFVPYVMQGEYCACPDMLEEDEELVPFWDILKNRKKPNSINDCTFCVKLFEGHGIPKEKTVTFLEKMFACDFILANHDRHYRNFGLIRNAETLEYTRPAPIFDTGSSLWCDKTALYTPADYKYTAKPFGQYGMEPKKQLMLFGKFDWLDLDKLKGFPEEAEGILQGNRLMTKERTDAILIGLEKNIEYLTDMVSRNKERKAQTKGAAGRLTSETDSMKEQMLRQTLQERKPER